MASTLGWMRIILSDDFIIMKRNGMKRHVEGAVKRMMAQPQLTHRRRSCAGSAGRIKRLGDDPSQLPNWMSDSRPGPSGLPSAPMAWTDLTARLALGPANKRRRVSPLVSPTARPTHRLNLFAVGIAGVGGQLDGVVQRDDRGASGTSGRKAAAK
jgi:hypothetical protein